jgi:hypothetical protein
MRTALMVHLKTAAARNGDLPLKTMALSCSLSWAFQEILLFGVMCGCGLGELGTLDPLRLEGDA